MKDERLKLGDKVKHKLDGKSMIIVSRRGPPEFLDEVAYLCRFCPSFFQGYDQKEFSHVELELCEVNPEEAKDIWDLI